MFAALPKLLGEPTTVASFEEIGFGQWFRYDEPVPVARHGAGRVVTVALGAVFALVARAHWPRTRALLRS